MITQLLIADSDAFFRERCRRYFARHGYQVELAADGLQCIEALKQASHNLLVLERELLWGGGDGVLAYLREGRFLRPEMVILISDDPANLTEASVEAPMIAVFKKSFGMGALLKLVRQAQLGDAHLAERFLRHAQQVAAMERYRRQWGPGLGPGRPTRFRGGV